MIVGVAAPLGPPSEPINPDASPVPAERRPGISDAPPVNGAPAIPRAGPKADAIGPIADISGFMKPMIPPSALGILNNPHNHIAGERLKVRAVASGNY